MELGEQVIDWLASVSDDPYAFVLGAFPWGEVGTQLETFSGPEVWQAKLLCRIRDGLISTSAAIQEAVASGHGVGKSALVAWLILWGMSTKPDTLGVVTANTETQLKTKTWAAVGKWYNLFIAKDMFTLTATAFFSKDPERERTWRLDMIPWSERNPEAFAGMHNLGKRVLVIYDEASAIPDVIWETTEGALTDANTQIIWCVFGNPTRNTGRFRECFSGGRHAKAWHTQQVDSREVSFTNKQQIANWVEAYGDDSDFVRIRVLGIFPRSGEMEFFNAAEIDAAMARDVSVEYSDPLALGVDVARFGSNFSIIFPRKGRDARTIPRERYQGLSTVDLAAKVFEAHLRWHSDGIFIDGGGVGGGVVDNCRHMHLHIFEVQFGGRSDHLGGLTGNEGEKYANKRAEIYGALRAWLKTGAIPNDQELRAQLLSITYTHNVKDEIILTSKEVMMREGKPSPDDIDGLATTFAFPLAKTVNTGGVHQQTPLVVTEYDPFDAKHMAA